MDPIGIAVGGGAVYVVDRELERVQKFSTAGVHQVTWGTPGDGPSEFNNARGIAVDDEGNVLVVDVGNRRIQKFDSNGGFLGELPMPFDDPEFQEYPLGVAVDGDLLYFTAIIDEDDFTDSYIYKYRRANSAARVSAEAKGVSRGGRQRGRNSKGRGHH